MGRNRLGGEGVDTADRGTAADMSTLIPQVLGIGQRTTARLLSFA
jgi:hypothetical protein